MSQQQQPTGQQSNRLQNAQQPQGGRAAFRTRNCLPQETRAESIGALNQVLADAVVLQAQCKAAHWNVKGPNFYQLHELFEDVAEMLEDYVDEIAERATALGGFAEGTVPIAAQSTGLPQYPVGATDGWSVLENVATSLASFDATLQMQIESASSRGDLDTADLLNELSRDVSKSLWFVEAHLQGGHGGQGAIGQQSQQIAGGRSGIGGAQQVAGSGSQQIGSGQSQQVQSEGAGTEQSGQTTAGTAQAPVAGQY